MLKELLEKQRNCTEHFFANIDLSPVEELVELLLSRSGAVFLSGVGKSGLVAKKIAFTMVSTGTRAFYLSPTDAVHGDLGMVSAGDTFVMLSKSGESDELITLAPAIRNKGATLISVVCNSDSRLAAVSHATIVLPFLYELCPFDMAPTMSTTSQLLFGDLLTIALMRHKKFSVEEYALNHPSGRLGKRITLKVDDLMLTGKRIPFCSRKDCLRDVLVEISNKRCGCVLIVDEEIQLLGIFTDGDLARTIQKNGADTLQDSMGVLMTSQPKFIRSGTLAWEAMKLMEANSQRRIMMLPVVNEHHRVVGLIHLHDIIQSGL